MDQNVKALFDIKHLPSDTHLRDVMDLVNPKHMRKFFTSLFAEIQKTKVLQNYEYITIDGKSYYLVSLDGTGYFSSEKIYCDQYMKYHEDEDDPNTLRFRHNVLAASMVHPDQREAFSFCSEPIQVQDGKTKIMTVRLMHLKDLSSTSDASIQSLMFLCTRCPLCLRSCDCFAQRAWDSVCNQCYTHRNLNFR